MSPVKINIRRLCVLLVIYLNPTLSLRSGSSFTLKLIRFRFLRTFLLPVACCLLPIASFSQSPTIKTIVDKTDILIGEQVKLTIKANFKSGIFKISQLIMPDSIPHFDVVDKGRQDSTTYKDNSKAIEQTITFTSFDSGKWVIPAFRINFDPLVDDTTLNLFSDPVPINVSYSPPDSTNQLRDIKPIIEVSLSDYTWYYIGGCIFLLLLAVFFIWMYLKKRKREPAAIIGSRLSPYEEAMQELKKLEQYDLQNAVEVKNYHTKLSDIFKQYLGRKQNQHLANRTTGDLLIAMAQNNFRQESISTLATALRCSDAVKFAKYQPTMVETEDCKSRITGTINLMEQVLTPKL